MKKYILSIFALVAVATSAFISSAVSATNTIDKGTESTNLVSTTIVISQVNGGGGGATGTYLFDYVELKNVSSTPQSLSGLSLYYGSAVGQFASTAGNAFALPNVTINPGQYYFVQTGPTGSAGAAFPVTPDATTGNLTMSGTSGKIALATAALAQNTCGATATPCSPTQLAALVDWVAYGAAGNGTAGNGEGGTATNGGSAITSSQGNVRKAAGCTDTDNNNADFDVPAAPVPRNTSTAVAPCGAAVPRTAVADLDGDGRTDYLIVRADGGGSPARVNWYTMLNGTPATTGGLQWGLATDNYMSADFDGDRKHDYTVWRPAAAGTAAFYILNSQTSTARVELFGQNGDDVTIVGDYDGDGRADPAAYRRGTSGSPQSTFYYRGSLNNPSSNVTYILWGSFNAGWTDYSYPGDFDGDGRMDVAVGRDNSAGADQYIVRLSSTGAAAYTTFGDISNYSYPGDYDGDGRTDYCNDNTFVSGATNRVFSILLSSGGYSVVQFGLISGDRPVQGDYDGDGRTDIAVWRSSNGTFYTYRSGSGTVAFTSWGASGDFPVAGFNRH